MAVVDIVFLVIIALSAMSGLFRGFVKEALSLASWVAAIFVAGVFSTELADMMSGLIENESLRRIAAFALLFVMTIFFGALLSNLASGLTSAAGLGGTDRVLGMLFGILRGVLITVLILFFTRPLDFTQDWFQGSFLVPYIVELSSWLEGLFSGAAQAD